MSDQKPPRRRLIFIVLAVLLCLAALCVVPPNGDRATIAVDRIGDATELLPRGIALSFWPLAGRHKVPLEDGNAVLPGRFSVEEAGGGTWPVEAGLHLEGAGVLPFDTEAVRVRGLEEAVGSWLVETLPPESLDSARLLKTYGLWQDIFGDEPDGESFDFAAEIAPLIDGPRVAKLELRAKPGREELFQAARGELANRTRRDGRLIVLGLDALDWSLADELMRRGLMPNLRRLVSRGAHAVLDVPAPLISPVVWTTIATGVSPEVHGILDFLEPDVDGGAPHPVGSGSCKAPTLWRMVAASGRTTSVIGWWATFPAVAPEGATIYSDRLTEQLLGLEADSPGVADPPEAAEAARGLVLRGSEMTTADLAPFARVDDAELRALRGKEDTWSSPAGGLAKLVAATLTVERLTQRELDLGTEVVLSYLEGTDTVGHLFAPYRPPALPDVDPNLARRFGTVVDRYYAWVDGWLGRVLAQLDDEDILVLVSDHGFEWFENRPRVSAGAHTATAVWWHRTEGAFLAFGRNVDHTPNRERLGIMDVAPTILALAGLPPGRDMPGEVPEWLLKKPEADVMRDSRPVRYASLLPVTEQKKIELSDEAREEELAKLRALGYLAPESSPESPASARPQQPVYDRAEARRLNNLGTSRSSSGDKAGAEEAFRQAIEADPFYAAAHYNLGLAYRRQGKMDESDREIWRAIELGVGDREMAVVRMALDYRQRGEFDRARAVFARGRAMFPDGEKIWINSGVFLGERGLFAESRECLEHAVELAPDNVSTYSNLAAALSGSG